MTEAEKYKALFEPARGMTPEQRFIWEKAQPWYPEFVRWSCSEDGKAYLVANTNRLPNIRMPEQRQMPNNLEQFQSVAQLVRLAETIKALKRIRGIKGKKAHRLLVNCEIIADNLIRKGQL